MKNLNIPKIALYTINIASILSATKMFSDGKQNHAIFALLMLLVVDATYLTSRTLK